eukprot:8567335-Lingulodinium_polyedra.AAC.1
MEPRLGTRRAPNARWGVGRGNAKVRSSAIAERDRGVVVTRQYKLELARAVRAGAVQGCLEGLGRVASIFRQVPIDGITAAKRVVSIAETSSTEVADQSNVRSVQ